MKRYEQIDHTADLAARIYGFTIKELFENAASCMFDLVRDELSSEKGSSHKTECTVNIVIADAADTEALLVEWLNELLYESSSRRCIFSEFSITKMGSRCLIARAGGYKCKVPAREIKAATYHDVKIKEKEQGFEVTIVFDV